MQQRRLATAMMCCLLAHAAIAADNPPPSGIGKQATSKEQVPQATRPTVVMPKPQEVVEETIQYMENTTPSPAQYDRVKQLYIRKQQQMSQPYTSPAKPVTRSMIYNIQPGVTPPVIRLAQGQLTTLVFSDTQGVPWMIDRVSLDRSKFDDGAAAGATSKDNTNILTLWPTDPAAYSNVAIRLNGLNVPVILQLAAGQREVDMRVDIQLPGKNPDSLDTTTIVTAPDLDQALTLFLDGVPPPNSKRMKVSGLPGTEAFMYNRNLYVRTVAAAQYPAYMAAAKSTAGVNVYRFPQKLAQVVLLLNGQASTVFLEE